MAGGVVGARLVIRLIRTNRTRKTPLRRVRHRKSMCTRMISRAGILYSSSGVMPKRKYQPEDDKTDGYADAECPECGAIINARFQDGRKQRKLQCPVCRGRVTVSIKEEEPPLIQLTRASAD